MVDRLLVGLLVLAQMVVLVVAAHTHLGQEVLEILLQLPLRAVMAHLQLQGKEIMVEVVMLVRLMELVVEVVVLVELGEMD